MFLVNPQLVAKKPAAFDRLAYTLAQVAANYGIAASFDEPFGHVYKNVRHTQIQEEIRGAHWIKE